MVNTYDDLVGIIENPGIKEILENEFPGDLSAAIVGVRMDVIVTEINVKLDTLSSQMSDVFGKVDRIEKQLIRNFNQIDKRFDNIETQLKRLNSQTVGMASPSPPQGMPWAMADPRVR